MASYVPEFWQGGGGWSQLKFSLDSLFEQRELLHNVWTTSNVGLPLVRYLGCKFKFYRTEDVDYIVYYTTCLPMLDNVYMHSNAQPSNMLMYKKKIIVKSKKTKPFGKLYVKKFIRPPEQFRNSWYFQVDLCKQGLVMITTTATTFDRFYLNPKSLNNNITLNCLNTTFFTNRNFTQTGLGTNFWTPKLGYWVYADATAHASARTVGDLTLAGQTQSYWYGTPINSTDWTQFSKKENWTTNFANPFYTGFLTKDRKLYISTQHPSVIFSTGNRTQQLTSSTIKALLTPVTQNLIEHVRYTPEKDKGDTNMVYVLSNQTNEEDWHPSPDKDLQYEGFPLWTLLWGWTDWLEKLKKTCYLQITIF